MSTAMERLGLELRINSLRAVYNLADAHTVPNLVGNHLTCRFQPGCNWVGRRPDEKRAKADFEAHIRMHTQETSRQRDLHCATTSTQRGASLMPNTAMVPSFTGTVMNFCSWRDCGQSFHVPDHLIRHVMQEHMHSVAGVYCPLCGNLIALEIDSKLSARLAMTMAHNNNIAYTDPNAYVVPRTHGNNSSRQNVLAVFVSQVDGRTYTATVPRGTQVNIASVTEGHPLQIMLQSILLTHYEGAKCAALGRGQVETVDTMARIHEWRKETHSHRG
ncbi:hypothetical protein BD626DRAFT_634371 [Schizophyllum amplum]|uniref:C2H2-type domain-containing protein n=1 Tax=Schizophyllum amplum TaxID=97359 RepID=A0A550BZM2_9AGAR|nr:hypothetical protein BD626DRAFT_634371 [Auriculariopsis ampla]